MTNTEYTRRVVKSLSYAQDVIHDAILDAEENYVMSIDDEFMRDAAFCIIRDITEEYPHITIHNETFILVPTRLLADDATTLRVAA